MTHSSGQGRLGGKYSKKQAINKVGAENTMDKCGLEWSSTSNTMWPQAHLSYYGLFYKIV